MAVNLPLGAEALPSRAPYSSIGTKCRETDRHPPSGGLESALSGEGGDHGA
jgi:hypothetical protein